MPTSHPYRERLVRCREGRWDLLVVGGSPAMCGIDPAVLTGTPWRGEQLKTTFNLGLPLATAAEIWLAAEHGPRVPPKLLVMGRRPPISTKAGRKKADRGR